ncbi:MAG TPA: histidine phosphatase family protein [Pyrinomonadaceae bacterium]|jgi:phosphohistidine phosphatase|nr:histidine phosphatase family protein [Pyrinomonadaceae bacterium]
MKTLYLLRHAESGLREQGLRDFDRPLNGRGREAAPLVGRFIRKRGLRVDLMLSSPAVRARQTADLVREAAGLSADLLYDERIYEADAARLLEVVTQAESADALMLVGHNPGMEELLTFLTGEERHMTTAALACVLLDVEKWAEARAGRLEWLVRPRELAEG